MAWRTAARRSRRTAPSRRLSVAMIEIDSRSARPTAKTMVGLRVRIRLCSGGESGEIPGNCLPFGGVTVDRNHARAGLLQPTAAQSLARRFPAAAHRPLSAPPGTSDLRRGATQSPPRQSRRQRRRNRTAEPCPSSLARQDCNWPTQAHAARRSPSAPEPVAPPLGGQQAKSVRAFDVLPSARHITHPIISGKRRCASRKWSASKRAVTSRGGRAVAGLFPTALTVDGFAPIAAIRSK